MFMKHDTTLIPVSPFIIKDIEKLEVEAKKAGRFCYKSRFAGDTTNLATLDQISFETNEAEAENGGVFQMPPEGATAEDMEGFDSEEEDLEVEL
jgi:hypothetical protein